MKIADHVFSAKKVLLALASGKTKKLSISRRVRHVILFVLINRRFRHFILCPQTYCLMLFSLLVRSVFPYPSRSILRVYLFKSRYSKNIKDGWLLATLSLQTLHVRKFEKATHPEFITERARTVHRKE